MNKAILAGVGLLAADFITSHIRRKIVNKYQDRNEDLQRVEFEPLSNLQEKFEKIKFDFYNIDGVKWCGYLLGFCYDNYWIDGAGYRISENKFKQIIQTTHELHNMCLQATDEAIKDDEILQNVFDIPQDMIPIIRKSWQDRQLDLLARYDFLLGKEGELYFLEVNGDTPSSIIEAGPAQKIWAEEFKLLQFNNIENQIKLGFQNILQQNKKTKLLMFQNQDLEDKCTFSYLNSILEPFLQAKIECQNIESIDECLENELKQDSFKKSIIWRQYPFEWLASETTRSYFTDPKFYNINSQTMIEPPWKIVMSNKAISALLYQMFPSNPHLIKSSLEPLGENELQLSKQKYAREGEYINYSDNYEYFKYFLIDSYIKYVHKPIFQKFIQSDLHKNRYITISCWVVQGKPCSVMLREDLNPIIGTGSSVVPYFIQRKNTEEEPIEVELKTNKQQSEIRKSLYGLERFDSNNENIKLIEKVTFENNQFGNFKQQIIQQNNWSEGQKQKIMNYSELELTEEQIEVKDNPLLIGFSQQFQSFQPGSTNNSINDQQNNTSSTTGSGTGYYGGGSSSQQSNKSSGNTQSQAQKFSKPSPKAGSTGKAFSTHS
ncbi:glutathionylspermidine synthase (macronuclear) [Tetrahymena thermophila SB210]|uniref:Glutathionylspermidine synthase n=1 Tax=Tetrahymena thermophila (strain SB210) TaxID=312017 RepID=I7MHI0_TETTS|nr:glutathionylspermidine synthase [Tetrahymena thermophila SB210]EAR87554.1 glutathionylspermidine synthase [Tetrahymena thermophila SB210]|eukprot:XP_001007799.1 glutathionylspermidine synthase [Tetrahymena thermophila SB210]